jgi:hypothetical protein
MLCKKKMMPEIEMKAHFRTGSNYFFFGGKKFLAIQKKKDFKLVFLGIFFKQKKSKE